MCVYIVLNFVVFCMICCCVSFIGKSSSRICAALMYDIVVGKTKPLLTHLTLKTEEVRVQSESPERNTG